MADTYKAHRRDNDEAVEFSVEWETPEDSLLVWRWDAEHNPFPVTPLSADFSGRSPNGPARIREGRPRQSINIHGYRYSAGQGGGMRRRLAITDSELDDSLARIDDIWENGWRADIEREANEIAYADYEPMSVPELVRRMEQYRDQYAVHMDLMFRPMDIVGSARDRLSDFLREKLGDGADVDRLVSELLEGQMNASLEANAALWDVSQMAGILPFVAEQVRNGDPATLFEQLRKQEGGAVVADALEAWLERYGRRSGDYSELREPTWKEDPTPVLKLLKSYIEREDPRAALTRAEARKQAVAAELKAQLEGPDRERFEKLVAGVERYIPVKESRNSVMSLSRASLRAPALAAGRKLVSLGAINQVDDVFFLTFAEIETAGGRVEGLDALINQRRAEHELWRDVVPPATLGGQAWDNPIVDGQIKGIPASRGKARGRARVILHLAEAYRLEPGEVLVTRSTTSAWTPLFLNAAAIVTDSGGILSHCAVVAREYQLPAVVGTYTATRLIADGDVLDVDGSTGLVTIERN